MSTAGYGMKFGKGYLGGSREPDAKGNPEPMPHQEGSDTESIHSHLQERHAATGHAHSHVEHHADGHHTSHHIDAGGQVSGPHDHENLEALKSHMDQFLNEEGQEGVEGMDEQEAE